MANVTNGRPKVGGAVYVAPASTTLPTDATTALASTFVSLGFISEDGLSNENSPESEDIKAWGGDKVLTVQKDRPDTFSFKLIEALNDAVLKVVYGDSNVSTASSATTVMATGDQLTEHVYAIDMIMKGGKAKRIVIPTGIVTNIGTISYKDDEAVGYEVTLTAEATYDSTASKYVTHYEYIA